MVVLSLLYAIYRGLRGWISKRSFTLADNSVRHITTTIAHVQLALGYVLYFNSPLMYWPQFGILWTKQPEWLRRARARCPRTRCQRAF